MATVDPVLRHIDQSPAGPRLRDSGVEVWILIAQLPAMNGDVGELAVACGLPRRVVEAAVACHGDHRELIDAQIAVNAA